ncbi:hypothetical protein EVAR_63385_1 [Eumeta japonica]|uniref:Uncharacterized protein n=1 Tax=Eumeta variegata TaxID=151549 RepID=A0A4C1YU87_EUMVA|nr:hypothetical protein EVAR_63385_1 [Eumeta japonica]
MMKADKHIVTKIPPMHEFIASCTSDSEMTPILTEREVPPHRRQNSSRVGCVRPLSPLPLGRIGRWSGREIARSALSLARSAQAERDNESCFFVHVAGIHRFIRRYHVKRLMYISEAVEIRKDRTTWKYEVSTLYHCGKQ